MNIEVVGIHARMAELEATIESLREKEAHWQLFSLATSNMLWNWDFADNSVERNIRFETAFGYAHEEVVTTIDWWVDRLHPDDRERVLAVFQQTVDAGDSRCEYEYRFRRRDGSYAHIRDNVFILRDDGSTPIRALGAMTDISEKLRLLERARRLASLEALGTLAAGIAHDFNNRLQGVFVAASILSDRLGAHGPEQRLAQAVLDHAHALSPLISQLMTFAKGGEPVRVATDLAAFVVSNVELALTGSDISAVFEGCEGPLFASVDNTQLGQVIHNLVVNAMQATPAGGHLWVGARRVDASAVGDSALEPGTWIELSFRDEGVGIPPEQLSRIFDLYYTTKATGTGLGLAIVWSVVARHGGLVRVESEPGRGACFLIYLRPTDERPSPAALEPKIESRSARVLIMDDQAIVRESLSMALYEFGYEVVSVDDGEAAIEAYRHALEQARRFDAVIVDLNVPGRLGGIGAKDGILELDGDARVIVTTGYSDDPVIANLESHGFVGALRKPFDMSMLGEVMRDVLG